MFDQNIKRIGFACMIVDNKGFQDKNHKIGTTTQKAMRQLTDSQQYEKLSSKVIDNLFALKNQIKYVSRLPRNQRMFRISSTLLPMYDHPEFCKIFDNSLMKKIKKELSSIGELARHSDIRLSMHPDQFCVLNSDNSDVVLKSIKCFEMHSDIVRMMGYGNKYQDFKVNVHLNGKTDFLPLEDMSEVSKNVLTLENDEKKGDIKRLLKVSNDFNVAMVFDIHHHWCNSEGEYMDLNSNFINEVISTWKGIRPTMHLSQSTNYIWKKNHELPNMKEILEMGIKRGKTFAHSDFIDNIPLIKIANLFNDKFDIMIEAKMKNKAVEKYFKLLEEN